MLQVGDKVLVTIVNTTSMGVSVKYLNYKGLLLLKPNTVVGFKRHSLIPGDVVLCRILRLNGEYFDALMT